MMFSWILSPLGRWLSLAGAIFATLGVAWLKGRAAANSRSYSAASITVPRFYPASGMPKALDLARKSSGSMLRTSVFPVQRAIMETSADMALMIQAAPSALSASVRSPSIGVGRARVEAARVKQNVTA